MKPINPKFNQKCALCEFFTPRIERPEAGMRWKLFTWTNPIPTIIDEGIGPTLNTEKYECFDDLRLFVYGKKFVAVYYWDGKVYVLGEKKAIG